VEIVTEHSIRIVLEANDLEFPKKVCHLEIIPQSEGAQIDCFNRPVGSGPFKFHGRNADREVELVAHETYHEGRPSLERVVIFYESDSEKSWARLLHGQTDFVQGVYPKDYEMIEKFKSSFLFDLNPYERYALVLFNIKSPLFSDPRVRLALAHAIDKEYIVKNLLGGFGMVSNGPMGVDSPFHDPTVKPISCDRRKALELFREAGWVYDDTLGCLLKDGRSFQFTILVFQDNQLDRRVAEYLKLCLNDVGVKMHIETLPFELLVEKYAYNDAFEAVLTEFKGAYMDPDVLEEFWSPTPARCAGAGCFEHPEVTELLSAAVVERDAPMKKALFHRLDTLMSSLQPGTFLYHKAMLGVISKRVVLKVPYGNRYFSIRQFKDASVAGGSDS
jgi:peptide/nickel transport system substrate-binding protein